MRRVAPLLLVALVAVACGGGGDTISKSEAKNVVAHAQLTAADLGAGWKKTADERPDVADSSDKQLERCVGKDLDVASDTLAESNTRTFERSKSDVDQQQLVASTAVLTDAARADRLFAIIADQKFADCITKAFEEELQASEEGVAFTAGDGKLSKGFIDGADHSAHITSPFSLAVEQLKLDGQVDLLLVSTGQTFSLLFGFSLGDPIPASQLGHLGDLLVARQKA
jgi:hypothetical protein